MVTSHETRFKELEKKFRFIADNIVDAVRVLDADTLQVEYVTSSVYKVSGFTAAELIG